MSKIEVQKIRASNERSQETVAEFDRAANRVRERAHALSGERGCGGEHALDDWLRAEHEFEVPPAELKETPKSYRIKVAVPGFKRDDIRVMAGPQAVMVKAVRKSAEDDGDEDADDDVATRWSAFQLAAVFRHIDLDTRIDPKKIKAKLKRGMLKIKVRKAKE